MIDPDPKTEAGIAEMIDRIDVHSDRLTFCFKPPTNQGDEKISRRDRTGRRR